MNLQTVAWVIQSTLKLLGVFLLTKYGVDIAKVCNLPDVTAAITTIIFSVVAVWHSVASRQSITAQKN